MSTLDSGLVFDSVAVSSTTAFFSKVSSVSDGLSLSYVFTKTGNATGTLKWQINNLSDLEYRRAVNLQVGDDFATREALNTTGWVDADLSPTATVSITATDPTNVPILLSLMGFRRSRLVYTNATNTGTIVAWATAG